MRDGRAPERGRELDGALDVDGLGEVKVVLAGEIENEVETLGGAAVGVGEGEGGGASGCGGGARAGLACGAGREA